MLEIESHIADGGWDQPGRLYALVETAELVRREPALASAMGLDDASAAGSLTPVEQDQLPAEHRFEATLAVDRVAAGGHRLRGRRGAAGAPAGRRRRAPGRPAAAEEFAREHPDRQEVRIVAGVTRAGSSYCALRLRAHDDDQSVVGGADLVPGLIALLGAHP